MHEGLFRLESRKIQKVGKSTLSVSLPKAWIKLIGVKQGDIVYLDQRKDGSLRIFLEEDENLVKEKPQEFLINYDQVKEIKFIERLIVGSYLMGKDLIKITSSTRLDSKQTEEIRNIVQKIAGLNIIGVSKKEVIIQCFIDPLNFDVHSVMQQLTDITSTMLNEAMEALSKFDSELANDVIKREFEVDSIYWLLTRLILSIARSRTLQKKMGLSETFKPTGLRLATRSLLRIARHSMLIAKIALKLSEKKDVNKKEINVISYLNRMTKKVFHKAVDSFLSRDMISANDVLNLKKKVEAEVEVQMQENSFTYLRTIGITMMIIMENSACIAKVAINNEIANY